jgi:hypothetical protein
MDPKKAKMLFGFGAILGGVLAVVLWSSFMRLGLWAFLGIILAVWFAMGVVVMILLRRQNRRR